MEVVLESSLKRLTYTSIAAILWNDSLLNFFPDISYLEIIDSKEWSKVLREVKERVEKLSLPDLLKNDLLRYVEATGWEMLCWLRIHTFEWGMVDSIPDRFLWTSHGTINLLRTAESLIHGGTLNILQSFELACRYCLEKQVFALWARMDEKNRQAAAELVSNDNEHNVYVRYWCACIAAERPMTYIWPRPLVSPYKAFMESFQEGNEVAAKFFLQKIPLSDRKESFEEDIDVVLEILKNTNFTTDSQVSMDLTHYRQYTQILCYVLNDMDAEQQRDLVGCSAEMTLKLFLEWPWQDHYVKVFKNLAGDLIDEEFYHVLRRILFKQENEWSDYDYKQLFAESWLHINVPEPRNRFMDPDESKKYILDSSRRTCLLLSSLCRLEDWYSFSLILKDISSEKREELLFGPKLCKAYKALAYAGRWNSLENFVVKCLSKEERVAFSKTMKELCSPQNSNARVAQLDKFLFSLTIGNEK